MVANGTTIAQWLALVSAELELPERLTDREVRTLLDLARDAAHQIDRPAAPLTTFLAGVAVGRGAPLDAVASRVTALAVDASPTGETT